jgi:predicted Rossmann-fold nucleotide-binding protein
MNHIIRPRRLFVSGGGRLSVNAATLWRELGRLLAQEDGLVVITGGLAGRTDEPTARTADWMVIEGMLPVLRQRGVPLEEHIETVLPDMHEGRKELIRFKEGKIRILDRRSEQARRFSMVHSADVVISVEGEKGTQSVLDMALAIERPILPLPCGGQLRKNTSKKVWKGHRADIINWFQMKPDEVEYFERIPLEQMNEAQVQELAVRVRDCLLRGFTQGCFVIMRFHEESDPVFDEAIVPALATYGYKPWRTDRSLLYGDVIAAIHDGISHCYFVIADTTGDRPNVMYELGFARAHNKPVILLRRANPDGSFPDTPFDFQTQSILKYTDDLSDLRRRLEVAIANISGKTRPLL